MNPPGKDHFNYKGGREAYIRRSLEKRSYFSFIPLNKWFKGCEGHHIDKKFVIYMNGKIHQAIYHSITKNINMDLINSVAWAEKFIQEREVD